MSSQDAAGILFSANRQQQAFKLLELPPEILALLESDNPPILYLKSAPSTLEISPAQAMLCTPDATYHIQQKNSSNPIMILEPTFSNIDNQGPGVPMAALSTIATIEDTLELSKHEGEAALAAPVKVNKWHEKFARGRQTGKGKD